MNTKTIELPLLGTISLKDENWKYKYGYHLMGYAFEGRLIDLDVHFIEVTEDHVRKVAQALNDLAKLNKVGLENLWRDFGDEGETRTYIDEWNSDIFGQLFSEEAFAEYIQDTDQAKSMEERLLSKLRLVRLGIYAESDSSFVTMDFAFGYELDRGFRDNMLVAKLGQNYELSEITCEG